MELDRVIQEIPWKEERKLSIVVQVPSRLRTVTRVTKDPFRPKPQRFYLLVERVPLSRSSCKNICWFSFKARHINLPF